MVVVHVCLGAARGRRVAGSEVCEGTVLTLVYFLEFLDCYVMHVNIQTDVLPPYFAYEKILVTLDIDTFCKAYSNCIDS